MEKAVDVPLRARPGRPWFTIVLLAVIGFSLLYGGIELLSLGGSAYYGVAGLLVLASATCLFLRRSEGLWVYAAMLAFTAGWAIWESGSFGWALVPRLTGPAVLGIWLSIPWVRRGLAPRRGPLGPVVLALGALAGIGFAIARFGVTDQIDPLFVNPGLPEWHVKAAVTPVASSGDWKHYGNDPGGMRFSGLDQINVGNVDRLEVAWSYRIGPGPTGFTTHEVTPLKIGDLVYVCSGYNDVAALDAETGKPRWRYSPNVDLTGVSAKLCRGVGYYHAAEIGECADRVFTNTLDARLIALDARTGTPCRNFGKNGQVSLLEGMGDVIKGYYTVTSAPLVAGDVVVIGGNVSDGQYWGEPSGVVRAFDARTGKLVWAFDAGVPDRIGAPPSGQHYTRATPNAWAPMSADEELGLIYVPTGNSTPDYFGGKRRPFDDEYASAVLALDIRTGRPRWIFQTTHHDLWDYDTASPPTLFDLPTPTGVRKALLQPTKRGELFVLDRVTGKPIFPVEELPAPQRGSVPEERLSKTQPYSVDMPSLRGPDLTEAMMWGITPLDQLWCRIQYRRARYDGPLTPAGLTPAINYPGFMGGADWGGATIDPDSHIMVINSNNMAVYMQFITRVEADRLGMRPAGTGASQGFHAPVGHPQGGTPYAVIRGPFLSPLGVPCQQPPFGRLTAINLLTRKVAWTSVFGDASENGPLGIPSHLPIAMGVPNVGGAITTKGGLTFIGASQDRSFSAYETKTGKRLWMTRLPAGGQATPMTYMSPSGRQMVVIAAGGHQLLSPRLGDHIIAYALPRKAK